MKTRTVCRGWQELNPLCCPTQSMTGPLFRPSHTELHHHDERRSAREWANILAWKAPFPPWQHHDLESLTLVCTYYISVCTQYIPCYGISVCILTWSEYIRLRFDSLRASQLPGQPVCLLVIHAPARALNQIHKSTGRLNHCCLAPMLGQGCWPAGGFSCGRRHRSWLVCCHCHDQLPPHQQHQHCCCCTSTLQCAL